MVTPDEDRQRRLDAIIDPSSPSIARAYSAMLGGTDFYAADLQVVEMIKKTQKDPQTTARTNRDWLIRVVRWLMRMGVRQFVDCGSGLPTDQNVHEVAQAVDRGAKVVYSDNDPTVQTYGRALLAENENTVFLGADLREPAELLDNDTVRRFLDFSEPIGFINCLTLHHINDEQHSVRDLMAAYRDALPSGSYVALTHITYPPAADDPDGSARALADEMRDNVRAAGLDTGYWREYEHVLSFFDGLELVEPGLVRAANWWPLGPPNLKEIDRIMYGGVARKP